MSGQHPTPWMDAGARVTVDGQPGTVLGLLRPGLVLWHVKMDDGRHISVAPWLALPLVPEP